MRPLLFIFSISVAFLLLPTSANAANVLHGLAVGAGVNQATKNDANETFCLSLKSRSARWEYGIDACTSEYRGGVGRNNFGFIWGAWVDDFQRPDWQDYGIYGGAGAGFFVLQQDFVDWSAGPFLLLGWDLSSQAGLEGKVGYFGENYWGTANFYWYFK